LQGVEIQVAVLGTHADVGGQLAYLHDLAGAMTRAGVGTAPPIAALSDRIPMHAMPAAVDGQPVIGVAAAGLQPLGFVPEGAAVRTLAGRLSAKADEIDAIANGLSSQLDGVVWVGFHADSFRSDWQSTHRTQLHNVATALRDAASRATANANQQEEASTS
jgi:hypothetical protein